MVGETVSHYRIAERLGDGAMGVVYRAEDEQLRRPVALKFLPPDLTGDETSTRRFMREARAASALDHPNICTVHEIGETDDGELFIVMPFYRGRTLKAILEEGPLDPAVAVDYARQIAAGLAHANEHGVVHRDIKPANIMVTDRDRVKIVDFGLALLQGSRRLTRTGAAVGTAAYMAPEQVLGAEVEPAADIWSQGVVFFEMLTGRLPFAGESEPALLYAIVHGEPAALNDDGRRLPDACASIVETCLAKDAAGRYDATADLRRDLDAVSRLLTPRPGRRTRLLADRTSWRRRLALPLLLLVLLGALALTPATRDPVLRVLGLSDTAPRGVGVLPFEVAGDDEDLRALADGLAWFLSERLSALERHDPSFWVVPPSVMSGYRATASDAARLRLGVDHTLKGTLRPEVGDELSLSLMAYDALSGVPRSEDVVDRTSNLETWQSRTPLIAADLLGVEMPPACDGTRGPGCTTVPAAFAAWLRGMGRLKPAAGASDPERAAEAFVYAVSCDSSFARARAGLGRALWLASGGTDSTVAAAAVGHLRRAAALDTTAAWPLVHLGDVYARWGEPADAVSVYERALAVDPRHYGALTRLGFLHRRLGNEAAATAAFTRSVSARPRCVSALVSLGVDHYNGARYAAAADCFRRVVEITPGHYKGYNDLGAVLFEMEDYDASLAMFERSIALEPTAGAYSNLGVLYFYRQRYGDAVDMCRRSLELNPEQYSVWGYLGEAQYWASGQRDSARVSYGEAVRLAADLVEKSPNDPYLLSDMASYHAHLDDEARSLELLARLEDMEEVYPEVMFIIADTYERLGRRKQALDWLERACDTDLSLAKIEFYPGLRELRTHDRYRDIVARRGG